MSEKSAVPPLQINLVSFPSKNRTVMAFLAAVMAAIFLAACAADPTPAANPVTTEPTTAEPTPQPTVTPTPTPIPYEDFAGAAVPPAEPERLARLITLLSLIPESYTSAVYLDMKFLRSDGSLATLISPEVLGLDVALPSIATGLVNNIAVAVDFQTRSLVTSFQGDFAIADMLRLASSFGLQLSEGGPQSYEGHDVWDINALGTVLSMAAADEKTGVAASGQDVTASDARALTEAALDAFDGRSARLLDAPGLAGLVGDVPSGFAAAVLSQCASLPLFAGVQGLPGCTGVAVSVDVLPGALLVFHALIGFADQDQAASALQQASEALESQKRSLGFEDLGVRQEGENVRVRVIVGLPKFTDVFQLFAPSR